MAPTRLFLALLPLVAFAQNWPSFRGPGAAGVAPSASPPVTWNASTGQSIAWKTPIPGLAHSSPIVWGKRVFLTTAISSQGNNTFKRGLYGDGDASTDLGPQQWKLLCLDLDSGKLLWQSTAYTGIPLEKRHIKSTYANATPTTDGRLVVALFGSQGLYAFDLNGKLLWQRNLGRINAGAYDLPEYEWGTASSPILHGDAVIVQCDQQKGSFIAAFDRRTGDPLWRTTRQELPSWGTPTVYDGPPRAELVTNSSNFIRAYDPATGRELWRLGGSSKITAPTPVFSDGIVIVASGRRPEAPIFAIRPGGDGDITGTPNVLWNKTQRGPYMPTPLILDGLVYTLGNAGIFDCYRLQTGVEVYRQRIPHQGSGFSSSPVAAAGRIYLSSEDGDVFVVQAGASFKLLATNSMNEPLMATPAIVADTLLLRSQHHLWAVRAPR
ncbi:MAG: PQQ-like beta-propeller repeat protein [Acidobacteria bacterium]|nr:PQQ-like beta-propeller repeat protein [Acidobacteriota bacterium]